MNELDLLKPVSRSFYLSIRALPRVLREPVALAYLLARTTDTIADSTGVDVEKRIELLDRFAAAIAGKSETIAEELKQLLVSQRDPSTSLGMTEERDGPAVSLGMSAGEKTLIGSGDVLLRQLDALSPEDRADVRALLAIITRGQRLDLTRWRAGFAAVSNAEELREYAYLVAGCVGEFWTRVCFRKVASFTPRGEADMIELGRNYGCGLQLVNILRDAGADLRAGRCYFPHDELRAAGIVPENLSSTPPDFLPIYLHWIAEARTGLDAGVDYCIAINPPRVRIATVLPALIGVRTLTLLEERGLSALNERVKVPRAEVRSIIASAAITLASRTRLRGLRAKL